MDGGDRGRPQGEATSRSVDLGRLLEERERLEALIKRKYTRTITVMFTDMKGSTALAEVEGDVAARYLIKKNTDIVAGIVGEGGGVLVKKMGDGTMSYFEGAADAVRAAIRIQQGIDAFNRTRASRTGLQVRIGLNTGTGIVEKDDVFGDVVNVAARYEAIAEPGEICISESTQAALAPGEGFHCRFVRHARLKEKRGVHKVFKVFWDEEEIARERDDAGAGEASETISLDQLRRAAAPGAGETPEDAARLERARELERDRELVDLLLLCEGASAGPLLQIRENLVAGLEDASWTVAALGGEQVHWFYRESITIGRVPEADFPLTNKALSRVPVRVGVREGRPVLTIESRGARELKPVELERDGQRRPLAPDVEHELGPAGRIVFSVCFPLEYRLHEGRFLLLRLLDPRECLRRNFTFTLEEIWREYPQESGRPLLVGV